MSVWTGTSSDDPSLNRTISDLPLSAITSVKTLAAANLQFTVTTSAACKMLREGLGA